MPGDYIGYGLMTWVLGVVVGGGAAAVSGSLLPLWLTAGVAG